MAIAAAKPTQPRHQISKKAFRQVFAGTALLFIALEPCKGAEIYRWVDAAGKTHFSDTPQSVEGNAPLRPAASTPATLNSAKVPEEHYSVVNQVKRLEKSRGERDSAKAGLKNRHISADNSRRNRRHASGRNYDRGYDGWESYSNLGPRTDLIRFQGGHPVYSPTLGFPSNDRGRGRGRHRQGSHLETSHTRRYRGGAVHFGR